MVKELDDVQIAEYKEIFAYYDSENAGFIDMKVFKKIFRSFGLNPSEEDFNDMKELSQIGEDNKVSYDQFIQCIIADIRQPDLEEDLLEAFKLFDDKNTGMCSSTVLKEILTSCGDSLTQDEFTDLMRQCGNTEKSTVDYNKYVDEVFELIKS